MQSHPGNRSSLAAGATAVLAALAVVAHAASARAEPLGTAPHTHAYAVVVGDNVGGSGQQPLRFAEDDARRVAQVLVELGHYEAADVRTLLRPDAAHLLAAVDDVAARARTNAEHGDQTQVLFYFSGHARASAVDLGAEELPLATLRDRLRAVPSTITIVVLDACQSGSFSRVKGAEPAADFSYNSVAGITQKGLAVMASSTAEELSQESDELKASYFTHHLVTALRGAGDADGDGRVSLDEAYRYAYRRTLASTARTQVGEQHVTLETDLAGQGEVPMTFPAEASAKLDLPAALEARVLVQQRPSGAVMADVQKMPGAAVRLALVAGNYDAVVAQKSGIVECHVVVSDGGVTEIDPRTCVAVAPDATASKGGPGGGRDDEESEADRDAGSEEPAPRRGHREIDHWALEFAAGVIQPRTDAYTSRLNEFGYQPGLFDLPSLRLTMGASRRLTAHLAAVVLVGTLAGDRYLRSIADETDTVSFHSYGTAAYLRAFADFGSCFGVYGQAGAGMGLGVVKLETQQTGVAPSTSTTSFGYLLSGAVGAKARLGRVATLFVQVEYDYAPVIHNLIGDTHDGGGFSEVLGLRTNLGYER
jgi:caspase domain-containing protein